MTIFRREDIERDLNVTGFEWRRLERAGLIEHKDTYSANDAASIEQLVRLRKQRVGLNQLRYTLAAAKSTLGIDRLEALKSLRRNPVGQGLVVEHNNALIDPIGRQTVIVWDRTDEAIMPVEFDFAASERALIIPVGANFTRLLEEAFKDGKALLQLSPRDFEEIVAEIFARLGYEVELTAQTRDHGRDIIAVRQSEVKLRFLIECKRYDPDHKVGVNIVRSLYGVTTHERATKGILATTSSFTKPAKAFFDEHIWELEPRDYDGIRGWIDLLRMNGGSRR